MVLEGLFLESVEAAVGKSVSEGKVLVVYCSFGDDAWLNSWFRLKESIEELNKVAVWLKLIDGTQDFMYFKQISPNVSIPGVTVIKNGQISLELSESDSLDDNWGKLCGTLEIPINKDTEPVVKKAKIVMDEQPVDQESSSRILYYNETIKRQHDEKLERDRILELIKADKAQRNNLTHTENSSQKTTEVLDNIRDQSRLHSKKCMLLIRLTDGKTLKNEFESSQNLNDVRKWVDASRTDGDAPYLFHRTIPRMTFTDGDEIKTLDSLELAPRSALILKSLENSSNKLNITNTQSPGLFSRVISGFSSWLNTEVEDELDNFDGRIDYKSPDVLKNLHTPILPSNRATPNENGPNDTSKNKETSGSESPATGSAIQEVPCSRSVSPNVYQFVNSADKDDQRENSTFNGNNISLESHKDD
ncbi:hypothetical protein Kpol_1035p18 [Vanderwaltozyma polyspora DSM 70294]|uniref:UBX domain-containing protein n=1 Tax=Vanderwaltozyma polyspora (strain ATCC 22028 / DSM 70294 / BCRC 21397 / CBS 2163 / NBRC 10782 / NRRL Y-8283 / UCD 57-17) TaxID=436907 RepID=A7TKI3_VANPO|nr:uncharacterized protein Kpol_1035p18 [Vanderwaltozyma polyspora DSM 70294]EDO17205.1 hypothetical protein Kpol_1035p18 [Vanderwaltozyma polyspora DSM 70294]